MERVGVSSSSLKSVGYDEDQRVLEVEFVSGTVYQYLGVPPSVFEELMRAASTGTFFSANIRKRFEYRQVA